MQGDRRKYLPPNDIDDNDLHHWVRSLFSGSICGSFFSGDPTKTLKKQQIKNKHKNLVTYGKKQRNCLKIFDLDV